MTSRRDRGTRGQQSSGRNQRGQRGRQQGGRGRRPQHNQRGGQRGRGGGYANPPQQGSGHQHPQQAQRRPPHYEHETEDHRASGAQGHPRFGAYNMQFERGWPFSIIDQLRDLRYDVSEHGFLRGIPNWFVGQATRYKAVIEASKIKGKEMADRNSAGPSIKMFRISNRGGTLFSVLGYYLRLFILSFTVVAFLAIAPAYPLYGVYALVTQGVEAAARAAMMTVVSGGFAFWLYTGDYDHRPGATLAD